MDNEMKTAFDIFKTVQEMDDFSLAVWHKAISDELWDRQKKLLKKKLAKKEGGKCEPL